MRKFGARKIQRCLLGDNLWAACATNAGGMYDESYFGEIADVLTWPAPTGSPTALGDKINYTGTIAMKSTKRMYTMYTTQDTSEVSDDSVGEIDGKSWETTYECFTPGTLPATLELIATLNNGNFFFMARERSGQFRIIGGPGHPAKIEMASIKTAKDAKGRKGTTFKVKTWGLTPAPVYVSATIPLTPAP